MDNRNHKLDAPNNEQLKDIEQLADRSELSTIYPHAHDLWEGELVSNEERERRRTKKDETLSFGIRKKFWLVGLLAPLPLVLLSVLIGFIFAIFTKENAPILVIPMMLLFLFWTALTVYLLRRTFEVFYRHGMRAMPYIVTLVLLLGISLQSIYLLTIPLHGQQLMSSVILVGVVELIWSIILSYGLIVLWTTPRLNGRAKVGVLVASAIILVALATFLTFINL